MTAPELVSFGARLRQLAEQRPEDTAIVFAREDGGERILTWRELDRWATGIALVLLERGARGGSMVVIGLPNCLEHVATAFGVWKMGACALPVSAAVPDREFEQIVGVASPSVVVADRPGRVSRAEVGEHIASDVVLDDVVSAPGKAICSGGSTGTPKVIVQPGPWASVPGLFSGFLEQTTGLRAGLLPMLPGPLYHNLPFTIASLCLYEGFGVVLMERFDAARCVELVERHRVGWAGLVPTMMQRIAKLPDIAERDLSSLEAVFHTAAVCPVWVKRAWIDLVGAERVIEAFAATEGIGHSVIRGDEWLEHPGSVGKPAAPIRITREDGTLAATGEVGQISFGTSEAPINYEYIGADRAPTTDDGFATLGDMGWLDEDGYLYIADRRVDLIISGGANVYPAEVEAALSDHPSVVDVAVIGLPDEEWGKRVHAVVETTGNAGALADELDQHCRSRLAAYKVPRSYEFVAALPRNEAGKIRRSAMVTERVDATTSGGEQR